MLLNIPKENSLIKRQVYFNLHCKNLRRKLSWEGLGFGYGKSTQSHHHPN